MADSFDDQLGNANRQRQMAEMLFQQGMTPMQGQMVSGHYVSPGISGGILKALQIYQGGKGLEESDQKIADLLKQRQEQENAWLAEMPKATGNTSDMGPVVPTTPTPEQYMAWALKGQKLNPQAAQMGMQFGNLQAQGDLKRELANMKNKDGDDKPYYQPVQTGQGIYAFNARTGKMELVQGAGGAPIVGAQADPALQGKIAGAKEAAELSAKSGAEAQKAVRKSDVMLDQIDQAEKLLQSGPTSSGFGAAIDAAGNLFGVSSKSADAAAQLEAISGWLVSNVPRMEGPQSNFDVQNYQTMAGMVGDKMRPISQRLKALEEVKRLQEKYKTLNQEIIAPNTNPATQAPLQNNPASAPSSTAPKRIRFDAKGNQIP